jgi:hypothetical protein
VSAALAVELPAVEPEAGGGVHQVIDVQQELVLGCAWSVLDLLFVCVGGGLAFVDVVGAVEQESDLRQRDHCTTKDVSGCQTTARGRTD